MIRFKELTRSLRHAARGIWVVYQTEQSFRIQMFAAVIVVIGAIGFRISSGEWKLILLLISAVLVLELVNSVFERIIDTFKPRLHPAVRDMKDMMAAAVLVVSLVALVIGLLIFIPYLARLF